MKVIQSHKAYEALTFFNVNADGTRTEREHIATHETIAITTETREMAARFVCDAIARKMHDAMMVGPHIVFLQRFGPMLEPTEDNQWSARWRGCVIGAKEVNVEFSTINSGAISK
jgi:2-keto-3-deoxy-galactonokinase